MAKRIVTIDTRPDQPADLKGDFSEFIRGLGDPNIILKIYRYASYPNKPEWMEDLSFEMIKSQSMEQYLKEHEFGGPGSYMVRGIRNGKWIQDGSRVIHIAGERKTTAAAVVPANGNGKHDGDMFRIFEFQMKMQADSADRNLQNFQQMMAANKQSSDQMMTLLLGLLSQNKPMDLKAMVDLMRDMNPATNSLEQLKQVVLVAKELGGGDSTPADPLTAAIGMIPALLEMRHGGAPATAAAPVTVEAQPVAAMPAGATQAGQGATPTAGGGAIDERIRLVMLLKSKAARGADISFWAEYLDRNQDEAAVQILVNAVQQHPWELVFATLQKIDPELAQPQYEQWFHALYDELRGPGEDDDTKNNSAE